MHLKSFSVGTKDVSIILMVRASLPPPPQLCERFCAHVIVKKTSKQTGKPVQFN